MKKHLIAAALMTCAAAANAQVSVTAPWVRATVPAQKSTGAFMHLQAMGDARLVGVSTPLAKSIELHQSQMDGSTMRMRQVDGIDLPAGRGVNLASGGYHIMLIGLKQQLKHGDVVPITLEIEHKGKPAKRESLTLKVPVKPLGFTSPHGAAAPMHH
ncbi:MAG: copper chaperone PCu(A)C [Pseudomonadota bacterium]